MCLLVLKSNLLARYLYVLRCHRAPGEVCSLFLSCACSCPHFAVCCSSLQYSTWHASHLLLMCPGYLLHARAGLQSPHRMHCAIICAFLCGAPCGCFLPIARRCCSASGCCCAPGAPPSVPAFPSELVAVESAMPPALRHPLRSNLIACGCCRGRKPGLSLSVFATPPSRGWLRVPVSASGASLSSSVFAPSLIIGTVNLTRLGLARRVGDLCLRWFSPPLLVAAFPILLCVSLPRCLFPFFLLCSLHIVLR
eukprot:SAG11_NODE_4013_length_2107_cov_90.408367_1_plen_252_part_00